MLKVNNVRFKIGEYFYDRINKAIVRGVDEYHLNRAYLLPNRRFTQILPHYIEISNVLKVEIDSKASEPRLELSIITSSKVKPVLVMPPAFENREYDDNEFIEIAKNADDGYMVADEDGVVTKYQLDNIKKIETKFVRVGKPSGKVYKIK